MNVRTYFTCFEPKRILPDPIIFLRLQGRHFCSSLYSGFKMFGLYRLLLYFVVWNALQQHVIVQAKPRFPFYRRKGTLETDTPTIPPTIDSNDGGGGGHGSFNNKFYSSTTRKISPPKQLLVLYDVVKSVLLYKPPVGIMSVWVGWAWLRSGKWNWKRNIDASEQALLAKASKLDRHSGRALDLDKDDLEYKKFGGIERVRRRLLFQALEGWDTTRFLDGQDEIDEERGKLITTLQSVLKVSFPPGGSHSDHVHQLLGPMAQAEDLMTLLSYKDKIGGRFSSYDDKLIELAMQTAEVRTLDALLRLTRDRLLRTSFRLSRTVQHWRRRVSRTSLLKPWVRRLVVENFEGDRMRLAFAEAAYKDELVRLGKVVATIMERPMGMDESNLNLAVQKTLEREQRMVGPKPRRSILRLPKIYNLEWRFNADGRGKFSFKTYEDSNTIGGHGAMEVLLQNYGSEQKPWLDDAKAWSLQARNVIYDIIQEAMETSVQSTQEQELAQQELKTSWCRKDYSTLGLHGISMQWTLVLERIRDLHRLRRVGEGKSVKLKETHVVNWFREWDFLGIPSAALKIALSFVVHQRLLPHWPTIQRVVKESFGVTNEIVQTRFWIPVRDLLTELFYRPETKLMTGISVQDEEQSLDYMLRDSGFGDGTPDTRHEAMLKATRQYEKDMKSGLLWHGNRLVKLILIQVQQLKVGMLHAADTVDVLLQANRFNIQLLAVIPAIVIVTVGTKVFFRFLFTLRVKDIRPISSVHAEMTEYLNQLESVLLLAERKGPTQPHYNSNLKHHSRVVAAAAAVGGGGTITKQVLTHRELGEFVSILYDYLVLLDYSSPTPFPSWQCDAIHQSVVEFLGNQGSFSRLGLEDHYQLIEQIKRKHEQLEKHL